MRRLNILLVSVSFCILAANSAERPGSSPTLNLKQYSLALGPKTIEGVEDNTSGLTYSPVTKTLFAAINSPAMAVELDLKGNFKRIIRLEGFDDTEGIAWIDCGRFAVLEERRRNLVVADIGARTRSVNYADCAPVLIDPAPAKNAGIEGVCHYPARKCLFIVKEKNPKKIYKVDLPVQKAIISTPWNLNKADFGLSDVSGVYYHAATGHLLILSDESKCIVECTVDGKEISRLSLKAGSAGLDHALQQPEGITMDDSGNLYICCEPNTLYVFSKKP